MPNAKFPEVAFCPGYAACFHKLAVSFSRHGVGIQTYSGGDAGSAYQTCRELLRRGERFSDQENFRAWRNLSSIYMEVELPAARMIAVLCSHVGLDSLK